MPTPEAQAAARDLLLAICSVGTEEEIGKMCAEALDRFAAQRGAEARDFGWVPEFLSDPPPPTEAALAGAELLSTLPLPEKRRLATAGEDTTDQRPTTAQTGGGDAGERAREADYERGYYGHGRGVVVTQPRPGEFEERSMTAGELAARAPAWTIGADPYEFLTSAAAFAYHRAWSVIAPAMDAALRSSHREGAETITDDMNAAHWHGYREGAEAMREDAATAILEQRCERGTPWDHACVTLAAKVRALPIPGSKTDAG